MGSTAQGSARHRRTSPLVDLLGPSGLVLVVLGTAALVWLAVTGDVAAPDRAVSTSRSVVGYGLLLGALAAFLVGLLGLRRSRVRGTGRRPSASRLPRAQRAGLLRQLRGGQAVDPRQLPLLRDLAARIRETRAVVPLLIGPVALQGGNAVLAADRLHTAVWSALLVGFLCVHLALRRDVHRAEAFLAEHPEG